MQVKINGKPYDVPGKAKTLEDLVIRMKLRKGNTLLKHNGQPVPWQKWPAVAVRQDDTVEMLTLISGG
jgi:thiamine biosynthesis protein ThiS